MDSNELLKHVFEFTGSLHGFSLNVLILNSKSVLPKLKVPTIGFINCTGLSVLDLISADVPLAYGYSSDPERPRVEWTLRAASAAPAADKAVLVSPTPVVSNKMLFNGFWTPTTGWWQHARGTLVSYFSEDAAYLVRLHSTYEGLALVWTKLLLSPISCYNIVNCLSHPGLVGAIDHLDVA